MSSEINAPTLVSNHGVKMTMAYVWESFKRQVSLVCSAKERPKAGAWGASIGDQRDEETQMRFPARTRQSHDSSPDSTKEWKAQDLAGQGLLWWHRWMMWEGALGRGGDPVAS